MIYFFDTSALIKKYLTETGSELVKTSLNEATSIVVSCTSRIECFSVVRRMMTNEEMTLKQANYLHEQIYADFLFFEVIPFSETLENIALEMVRKHQLRTLDAIQLASAVSAHKIHHFFVSDIKLKVSGRAEGLSVIDPNEAQL